MRTANISDAMQDPESDLRRTAQSLVETRPELMEPEKLQLFESLLRSHIETNRLILGDSAGHLRQESIRTAMNSPSKFMAFVIALIGAYITVMLPVLVFPAVPTPVLPVLALIGFFGTRFLTLHMDRPVERRKA